MRAFRLKGGKVGQFKLVFKRDDINKGARNGFVTTQAACLPRTPSSEDDGIADPDGSNTAVHEDVQAAG